VEYVDAARFNPAVTEKQCPDGYLETGKFPDGDMACIDISGDEQVWTAAIDVVVEREFYDCPRRGTLVGETCVGVEEVDASYWECTWTKLVCSDPVPSVDVDVCHKAGPRNFTLITVSVHSVDDANGLNGHGKHEGDGWGRFFYDGRGYGAQGNMSGCDAPEPTEVPPDQPSLRIGGRCTEDGDSQEIGYVFDDGDFDDARLIITRSDGVEVANEGEGSGFFPARAGAYSYEIIWFNGQTREVLDSGKFEVLKCDAPVPTPVPTATPVPGDCSNTGDNICPGDDDDPKAPKLHPSTGADPSTVVPIVMGLGGFALAGIGVSILYMRRRASR
jgi:hypothetical protein